MNNNPASVDVISQRYEALITAKLEAGLPRKVAEEVAYAQIVQEGREGDPTTKEAAIEFLISLRIKSGASAVGAAHWVMPLFGLKPE
jgi:hypothetical protein